MNGPDEFHQIRPGLSLWHAFDLKSKAELFSTAVATPQGTLVVDPIPLAPPAADRLFEGNPVRGIIVTNSNHWRDAQGWSEKFSVPIFTSAPSTDLPVGAVELVEDGEEFFDEAKIITIPGGPEGEIAVYFPEDGGTLVVGDALIHFEPYGFSLLPAKYCIDHREMCHSLRKLLALPFERILFAHGTPIMSVAATRLQALLNDL